MIVGARTLESRVIDTHCHLTFPDYAGKIDETLAHARSLGVTGAITISTQTRDAVDALRIAHEHDNVWCSVGVHPLYAHEGPHDWDILRAHAKDPKCVAFGELGLDHHHSSSPHTKVQFGVLAEQLAVIESIVDDGEELPIVIHCRKALDDLIPILKSSTLDTTKYVFHCFTGDSDDARAILDLGASLSFTGVVTYKNAKDVAQAAAIVPDDRLMVETDAPFLSPEPMRGERPCRPGFARYTAEFLADIRGVSFRDFHHTIDNNTHNFFGIRAPIDDDTLLDPIA